jgi:hypothetical protein
MSIWKKTTNDQEKKVGEWGLGEGLVAWECRDITPDEAYTLMELVSEQLVEVP